LEIEIEAPQKLRMDKLVKRILKDKAYLTN
jgi:hypothetical protein